MKKRICALALAIVFVIALVPSAAVHAADAPIRVTIDGRPVNFANQQPVIIGGSTLVPIRGVFEQLGFGVAWDGSANRVTLSRSDFVVVLTIGSAAFTTNGVSHRLDVPAQIIGGSTMLPLRAVLESVGYNLDWDRGTRTVIVSTGQASGANGPGTGTPAPLPENGLPIDFGGSPFGRWTGITPEGHGGASILLHTFVLEHPTRVYMNLEAESHNRWGMIGTPFFAVIRRAGTTPGGMTGRVSTARRQSDHRGHSFREIDAGQTFEIWIEGGMEHVSFTVTVSPQP
jgi:hypothetical protein